MSYTDLDKCILKTLVSNKRCAIEFVAECDEKVFEPFLWKFAKTIIEYIKVYKEVPTRRVIIDRAKADKNIIIDYVNKIWDDLDNFDYDFKEFKFDVERIKERFAKKIILELKQHLVTSEDSLDVKKSARQIELAKGSIKSLYQQKTFKQDTLKESINDFRQRYKAKTENPAFGQGVLTGYTGLDFVLNGIRKSEMLLIAADSGGGKSMMLMNMAIQMYMQQNSIDNITNFKPGCNVVYFSLEMPFEDCQERMFSRMAMVDQKDIRDGRVSSEDLPRLGKAVKFVENYPYDLEIVDIPRGATAESLELILNDIKTRFIPDVVVVDYLGLMSYDKEKDVDDWLKLGKISEQLHELGRVHDVVMLSAVQLNRAGKGAKTTEEQIGMHRVGRSSMILHNANFAIQIEQRTNEQQHNDLIWHLIKSRRTELTKGRLLKNFSCCALTNDGIDIENNRLLENAEDISEQIKKLME